MIFYCPATSLAKHVAATCSILTRRVPTAMTSPLARSFGSEHFNLNKYDEKEIRELSEEIDKRLKEAEKEDYCKRRGLQAMKVLLKAEKKVLKQRAVVYTMTAQAELNRCIYTRHALRHGAKKLKELKPKQLAKVSVIA